jgi:hypothetical protein
MSLNATYYLLGATLSLAILASYAYLATMHNQPPRPRTFGPQAWEEGFKPNAG